MPSDTRLHKAAHLGKMAELIDLIENEDSEENGEQYDVNAPGAGERRPLHRAAGANRIKALEYLIEKGAIVDQTDTTDRTPLHWAAINGHVEAGEILVEAGADLFAQSGSLMTVLHAACEGGFEPFVKFVIKNAGDRKHELFNALDSNDKLPFELAVEGKHSGIVRALKAGGDENCASAVCIIS